MPTYRVGLQFDSAKTFKNEPAARAALSALKPQGYAWLHHAPAKHWELCHVDCRTGELFTTGELERLNARGMLK